MVNIPNRLLTADFVQMFYHDDDLTILEKEIQQAVEQRPSYVTKHGISIVLKGKQRIETEDGQWIEVAAGQLAFVRQGLYTVTDLLATDGTYASFHFFLSDAFLKELLEEIHIQEKKSERALFTLAGHAYFSSFIESIRTLNQQLPTLSKAVAKAKLLELVSVLLTTNSTAKNLLAQWRKTEKKSLVHFMNAHYDKPFSIEDYAFLTGRSVATFRREFKLKFNVSPRQWIIKKRLAKAQQLLQTTNLTIQEVALAVGYDNASYFVQAYKKYFDETPRRAKRGKLSSF